MIQYDENGSLSPGFLAVRSATVKPKGIAEFGITALAHRLLIIKNEIESRRGKVHAVVSGTLDIAAHAARTYPARVKPIEAPDVHHFSAACGWLELGNRAEARVELAKVSAENQLHPAMLDLQWTICVAEQNWDEAFRFARQLVATLPDEPAGWLHCAYALRRKTGGGLELARDFLEPAAEKFPEEPVIAFNLACYECQLQQLDKARRWFQRACVIGGEKKIHTMALADEDLKALWPEIQTG